MQSGGSAAINGFLYQILKHLDWLTNVSMNCVLDGHEMKDGCLILEPGDGGDAKAQTSSRFLVEQYKTRANRTWSLSALEAVLRDLLRAVPETCPENARYRFVTDGKSGRLEEFESFITRLNAIESIANLNNEPKRNFTNSLCLGDQDFLGHLAVKTQSKSAGSVTVEKRELVAHLLRNFKMEFEVGKDELINAVETRLRPHVENLGDEAGVRQRLIGNLMERLGLGAINLDKNGIDTMFQKAGLRPDRVRKVRNLARTLEAGMRRRSGYLKYRGEKDVRDVPHWPGTKPVLLIAGESGSGKSWQLARLMEESVEKGESVVFVQADGTAEDILRSAADDIWQVALGETSEKKLQAISNFFREEAFRLQPPLYTIAVDDVQSNNVARNLIRQDWTSLGARLVLTVPLGVARSLKSEDGESIQIHCVDEFTVDQLDVLLKMYGHQWGDLPQDLKRLLRKPVLAGLFVDLAVSSFRDAPHSEYEIFQAFWDRIEVKCNVGDTGIVVALAASVLQSKHYPLPREHWNEIGLDKESLAALELAGWLSCLEHGEVAIAHDRLLNWAIAQYLYERFMCQALSVDELFASLTGVADGIGTDSIDRFGYVAMDTLWLLSAEEANQAALGLLLDKMESQREFGGEGRTLYTKLLPTLGQRAVPLLLQRLGAVTDGSVGDYRVSLIGDGITMVARHESVDIRSDIESLLQSQSWDLQSVAVKVLATAPDPRHMDRLWEIHQKRLDALGNNVDGIVERGHETTFLALRVGVRQEPEWLRERIRNADPVSERVAELGNLLSGLDDPSAENIWIDVRDALMKKVPANNPRCLLHCVGRFTDYEYKDFVIRHLSFSGNIVSVAALVALAILDPKEAIDRIADMNDEQQLFVNEWLPLLLGANAELTRARIRQLAVSDSRVQYLIEDYFEKQPADVDEETLGLVLRNREMQLREKFGEVTTVDLPWHYFPLRFLNRMCSPELLLRLQDEAGGELEGMVVELGYSRLRGNSRVKDHILEAARRTLLLFAGSGISDLINRELESEHFWIRLGGLNWAWVCGNEGTIERLAAIARRPIVRDSSGKAEADAWQEFSEATMGLAALGGDEVLVEIFSNPEWDDVPLHLANFRAHRGANVEIVDRTGGERDAKSGDIRGYTALLACGCRAQWRYRSDSRRAERP